MFGISLRPQDIILYSNIMSLIAIIITILYWYFFIHRRGNVYFLKKNESVYFQVGHERIKPSATEIQYDKKSYTLSSSFFDGNKPNVYIDIENGDILTFKNINLGITPKMMDLFLGEQVISQIMRKLNDYKLNIMFSLIFAITGFALGLVIYPYFPKPS